jgi:hypothetical protein
MWPILVTHPAKKGINPQRVLAFLNTGIVAPEFGSDCELGFGLGLSAIEENLAEFKDQANTFVEKQLHILNKIQIT